MSENELNKPAEPLIISAFDRLSTKQKLFVLNVVRPGASLTSAATLAGYSPKSADCIGQRLSRKAEIKAAIDEIFRAQGASVGEVVNTLTCTLRTTFDDFLEIDSTTKEATLDLQKAKDRGVLGALKKITIKEYFDKNKGASVKETTVELHDKLTAAHTLAKHLRMFDAAPAASAEPAKTGVLEVPSAQAAADKPADWDNAANALEPKE